MLEFLQFFEGISSRLEPIVLVLPGLLFVLLGLFIWLAGLRYAKIIAGLLGVLAGGICGLFLIGRKLLPDTSIALFVGFIAMFLHKLVFILLAVLIVVAGVTFFLANGHIEGYDKVVLYINNSSTETISVSETTVILGRITDYLAERTKALYAQFSLLHWAAVIGLGFLAAILSTYFGSIVSALCCATLGTVFNFAGMILLLFYKGAEPVSRIGRRSFFFAAVFAVMIGIGTAVQLLLFLPRRIKSEPGTKKEPEHPKSKYVTKMPWLKQ